MTHEITTLAEPASRGPKVSFEREHGVYAILVTRDVAHAVVSIGKDEGDRTGRILRVFQLLTDAGIPILMIKLHRTAVSFGLAERFVERTVAVFADTDFKVKTRHDLAMVTVKAPSMRDVSGIMVDIADALHEAGAQMYGTGDAHDTVQCLIDADRVEPFVTQLRVVFRLDESVVQEHPLHQEVVP